MEIEGALGKCSVQALRDVFGHSSEAGSLNRAWPQTGSKNPPFKCLFFSFKLKWQEYTVKLISAAVNGISHSGRWQSS